MAGIIDPWAVGGAYPADVTTPAAPLRDRPELTGVRGLPENLLSEALLATLPANLAPAPWDCVCSAVVWTERGGSAAAASLAAPLRGRRALAVTGGLVQYESTPVGPYGEALALVAGLEGRRPWVSVPFMAVDSPASLVGGRTNWALPKSLAAFEGTPGHDRTVVARGVDDVAHGDWEITTSVRPLGPAVPVRTRVTMLQEFPGEGLGRCPMTASGRVRPALVTVTVRSSGRLGTVLRGGRRLGAVVESSRFTLGEPAFA